MKISAIAAVKQAGSRILCLPGGHRRTARWYEGQVAIAKIAAQTSAGRKVHSVIRASTARATPNAARAICWYRVASGDRSGRLIWNTGDFRAVVTTGGTGRTSP